MKTLVLEHTAPFQGLPELVADAEGLFAKEGLKVEFANTNVSSNVDDLVAAADHLRRSARAPATRTLRAASPLT